MRRLVAEHARQFFLVLHEMHQRVGHVDVAARDGKGVRRLLVHEDEVEGVLVLRIGHRLDAVRDRLQHRVQGRVRDDLALLLELLVDLLADLLFLVGSGGRRRKAT